MPLDFSRARPLLQSCNLPKLFIEELGWEPARQKLTLRAGETDYAFTAVAEKRGFTAWLCESPGGGLPDHATRLKLDRKLSETSFEHLIVFVTGDRASQSWMWVRREQGKPLAARTHEYHRRQPGDSLLQKLQILYVSLEEEDAGLSTVTVAGRARAAFDIERVTKAFYRDFDTHRKAFLEIIGGFPPPTKVEGKKKFDPDQEWYASVMLNRLMFVYFIQRKGFLDGNHDYLRNRLDRCKKEQGKDKFYTFYRYFLLRLFHEGFGKRRKDRAPELEKLLGNIPYLNGGLFDEHELEKPERYGKEIAIPDKAFERIFDYFDKYQWHLDERPLRADNEINPDVLGYIFEKYINQKQMGAYYTKEDITEYISKSTVIPFLFDAARAKCKVAFENPGSPTVWDLLRENPDRYIYPALRHGSDRKLPPEIAVGLDTTKPNLIERRQPWNKPAPADYALPTEIWREVVARRQRYEEVRKKLAAGEVREVNDFITLNLDLRQFAQDVILNSEGPDLLRAVWNAIQKVTVLDPTCGSGAFLFAALNILEPLYEICLDRMEAFVADDDRIRPKSPEDSVRDLIASGESLALEFKSTARWNVRESKADKAMEQVIIKTVAAFLNSDGGDLLIGVQDDGNIFGIEADQQLFSTDKRNRDTYENWLMTQLLGAYGKQHAADLRISFVRLEEKDVCRVSVSPASSAAYVKENNQDTLYVRTGNSTRALTTSEAVAYHQQRFTNFTPPPKTVEQSKASSPKKYADFRTVIERVSAHPKRSYFIFKSIILNNLFGVDIMEEAVEICKLRLFLKLAAQVEPDAARDNLGIEPLPDIDFNIRAGNTLVGYATANEVRRCMKELGGGQMKLMDEEDLGSFARFNMRCADVEDAFARFRQLQTEGDDSVAAPHKLELQKRLKALEGELNRHLAGEYRVKLSDKAAYAKWLKSHQPFHWFIQFYGILNSGGFDVIIGNPPYLEYSKVKDYKVRNYKTEQCANLYVFTIERSYSLTGTHGRMGIIIPISIACSGAMAPLRDEVARSTRSVWLSHFSNRPGQLFTGAQNRLTILITSGRQAKPRQFSTCYHRWDAKNGERENLFPTLRYQELAENSSMFHGLLPKMGCPEAVAALEKVRTGKTVEFFESRTGRHKVYWVRVPGYFCQFLLYPPMARPERGGAARVRGEVNNIGFDDKSARHVVHGILNSSTYYQFFCTYTDTRHINPSDVSEFPLDLSSFSNETTARLADLSGKLSKCCLAHTSQRRKSGLLIDSIDSKPSKPILDEIDTVLAGHYGFTAEELDFILNYDIKYRLGRGADSEQD